MKDTSNNIILLNEKDNVVTALRDLNKGFQIKVLFENNKCKIITLKQDIGVGFKVNIKDIKKGENVYKYGHVIGIAKSDIKAGERVHIENISSLIK